MPLANTPTSRAIGGWHEQGSSVPPLVIVERIRAAIHEGRFDTRDWDHGSPNYRAGRSNKQVKRAAAAVLGRAPVDMKEAWETMISLAVGPDPVTH